MECKLSFILSDFSTEFYGGGDFYRALFFAENTISIDYSKFLILIFHANATIYLTKINTPL